MIIVIIGIGYVSIEIGVIDRNRYCSCEKMTILIISKLKTNAIQAAHRYICAENLSSANWQLGRI